jgi:hypothetical protein
MYLYITRNNGYHRYVHNLEVCNSKPLVAGCILYNKLPNNIKGIGNNILFKKELKNLLIKGCYYSVEGYFNEELSTVGYLYA